MIRLSLILLLLVSCGPSREDIEAREKEVEDSTRRAESFQSLDLAIQSRDSVTEVTETSIDDYGKKKKYCNNSHFIIGLYNVNGCEYICFAPNDRGRGNCPYIVHAGNCNNPIHSQPIQAILPSRTGEDPIGKY